MVSVIDRVREIQGQAERDYLDLVQRLVDGQTVDPQEAASILGTAGKSADNLQSDTNKAKRRQELLAVIARTDEVAERRIEIDARRAKEKEEWAALLEKERQADARYQAEIGQVRMEEMNIGKAKEELRELDEPNRPRIPPLPNQFPKETFKSGHLGPNW